jgi:hypothetical protein
MILSAGHWGACRTHVQRAFVVAGGFRNANRIDVTVRAEPFSLAAL